jgi:Bacterial pre-peptidase C-terminal domain
VVRHGRRAAGVTAVCALIVALTAPAAVAAVEVGDAGDVPATAQEVGPPGPLTEIQGTATDSLDRDVYKICLTGGGDFSASTVGGAGFDTQLFLLNEGGFGVYANDDGGATGPSLLPANHPLTPTEPGTYYLAISHFDYDPISVGGPIFPNRSSVVGPTGRGGTLPMTGWTGTGTHPGGTYTIFLEGTLSCIPPDTTAPVINLRTPPDGAVYERGQVVLADYGCVEEEGGSGLASCEGPVPSGSPIDTATSGPKTFTVTTSDERGNADSVTHSYTVVEPPPPLGFHGFLRPLSNPPAVNVVKAGHRVLLKFTLNRVPGQDPYAEGYPRSGAVPCDSGQNVELGDPTQGRRFRIPISRTRDFHAYQWSTDKRWAGTCRQFVLKLADGSVQRANFRFRGRSSRPPKPPKPGKPGKPDHDDDRDDD